MSASAFWCISLVSFGGCWSFCVVGGLVMGVVVDIVVETVGWDGMGCWEEVERFGHTGI